MSVLIVIERKPRLLALIRAGGVGILLVLAATGCATSPAALVSTGSAVAAISATPPPSTYVVHEMQSGNQPGAINVIDTATGAVIRTLGAEFDPYLQNGFQLSPDGYTLYYTRLNEPAQTIEIVAAPLSGAPSAVIATGTNPLLSPDGTQLAFEPSGSSGAVGVMRLADRSQSITLIPGYASNDRSQLAWINGTSNVYVTVWTLTAAEICESEDLSPSSTCPPESPIPDDIKSWILDSADGSWAPAPSPSLSAQMHIALLGPGASAGTVLAGDYPFAAPAGTPARIISIDPSTGTLTTISDLPPGTTVLARSGDGTNFLLAGATAGALQRWAPGEGPPTSLGDQVAEAAW